MRLDSTLDSKSTHLNSKVIIIGAGVAGLALGQGLNKYGVPFHVYEQAPSAAQRRRRYRIRMHREGMDAMQYLLSPESWALVQMSGTAMAGASLVSIDASTAALNVDGSAPPSPIDPGSQQGYIMDIDVLLAILGRGIEEHVTYGQEATAYEAGSDGRVTVRLEGNDGEVSTAKGTLLVAADGVDSTIRKQFIPEAPSLDTGEWCIYGETPLSPALTASLMPEALDSFSHIRDCSGEGNLSMLVETMAFPKRQELQRYGIVVPPDYLSWAVTMPSRVSSPEERRQQARAAMLSPAQCERLALDMVAGWHDALRPIVELQTPGSTNLQPLVSAAPALPVWTPRAHLTLVGDAIHSMSAASGSGAVIALRDAHHLCQALVEKGTTAAATGDYEAAMRQYAGDAINASFLAGQLLFGQAAWEECEVVEM